MGQSEEKLRPTKKGKGAKKGTDDSGFGDELALSAAAASGKGAPQALKAQALKAQGEKSELYASNLDRMPLTQKTAAGQNTVSNIAGLKPWSKDWVFEPGDEANPDLKPLLVAEKAGAKSKAPLIAASAQADVRGDGEKVAGDKAGTASELTQPQKLALQEASKKQGKAPNQKPGQTEEVAALAAALSGVEATQGQLPGGRPGEGDAKKAASGTPGSGETSKVARPIEGGLDGAIAAQLQAMNGEMKVTGSEGGERAYSSESANPLGPSGNPKAKAAIKDPRGDMGPARASASGLSGGEFVSTLNSLKSGTNPNSLSGEMESSIRGVDERMTRNGPGAKPQLQVLRNDPADLDLARVGAQAAAPVTVSGLKQLGSKDGVSRAELTGHVTQGPMTRERLSSESVRGLAPGIRGLAPQGGGRDSRSTQA